MLTHDQDRPVHFPKSDRFEFDEEVAEIFPNMAERSIPLYREMHKFHAKILVDDYLDCIAGGWNSYTFLDIGASRAEFYYAIAEEAKRQGASLDKFVYTACDLSTAMVSRTFRDNPTMRYYTYDLSNPDDFRFSGSRFDAVAMHYVMQFIPVDRRYVAYERLARMLRCGGLLFYGEKETLEAHTEYSAKAKRIAEISQEFYIDFRVNNGYSREEIEAKTKALGNSMWPVAYEHDTLRNLAARGFTTFVPTCRLGLFHTFVAIKG